MCKTGEDRGFETSYGRCVVPGLASPFSNLAGAAAIPTVQKPQASQNPDARTYRASASRLRFVAESS
jgi:hypothetical protein